MDNWHISNIWYAKTPRPIFLNHTIETLRFHPLEEGYWRDRYIVSTRAPSLVLISESGVALLIVQVIPLGEDTEAFFTEIKITEHKDTDFQAIFTKPNTNYGFMFTNVSPFPLSFNLSVKDGQSEHQLTNINFIAPYSHLFLDGDIVKGKKLYYEMKDESVQTIRLDVCEVSPKNGSYPGHEPHFSPKNATWKCSTDVIVQSKTQQLDIEHRYFRSYMKNLELSESGVRYFMLFDSGFCPFRGLEVQNAIQHSGKSECGTETHSECLNEITFDYQMPHMKAKTLVFGLSAFQNVVSLTGMWTDFPNQKEMLRQNSVPPFMGSKIVSEDKCCMCFDDTSLCLIIPCLHKCFCRKCLDDMRRNAIVKCPVCGKYLVHVVME